MFASSVAVFCALCSVLLAALLLVLNSAALEGNQAVNRIVPACFTVLLPLRP